MEQRAYIDRALDALFHGRAPDPLPMKKKEILRDEPFELDVTLGGFCYIEPSDPGSDYRGFTEVNRIAFMGTVYNAQDFPPEFVKALERELI